MSPHGEKNTTKRKEKSAGPAEAWGAAGGPILPPPKILTSIEATACPPNKFSDLPPALDSVKCKK